VTVCLMNVEQRSGLFECVHASHLHACVAVATSRMVSETSLALTQNT
jgi:hypothetical protein